jgi:hypothetical protein
VGTAVTGVTGGVLVTAGLVGPGVVPVPGVGVPLAGVVVKVPAGKVAVSVTDGVSVGMVVSVAVADGVGVSCPVGEGVAVPVPVARVGTVSSGAGVPTGADGWPPSGVGPKLGSGLG